MSDRWSKIEIKHPRDYDGGLPVEDEETKKRIAAEKTPDKLGLSVVDDVNLRISPSTIPEAGLGLFALRRYEVGEPITGYEGKLVTLKAAAALVKQKKDSHLRTHILMRFVLDGNYLADGTPITDPVVQLAGKGGAAFVNHKPAPWANAVFDFSDTEVNRAIIRRIAYQFNRALEILPDERVSFLRATRVIEAGDEIFADYGKDYWERAMN